MSVVFFLLMFLPSGEPARLGTFQDYGSCNDAKIRFETMQQLHHVAKNQLVCFKTSQMEKNK